MKIGLVGAPGAQKTEVARLLARGLEDRGGRFQPVAIVDDYARDVEQNQDLACGFLGSYIADMAVALARFGGERQAVRDGAATVITCGTLAETATYTAMNCELAQNEYSWAVANVSLPYYALLATNAMRYDHAFYLPLQDGSTDLTAALDREVQGSLQALSIDYKLLHGDTPEQMAQWALGYILVAA